MVKSRSDETLIQSIMVSGKSTYRVLVDQPIEQARRDGIKDAWPVRLCAADGLISPCGHVVVSQGGIYHEKAVN